MTRRDDGFTLIELLVAMILLGIAGILITRTLMGGLDGSQKGLSTQEAVSRANAAMEVMAADIRSARAPNRDRLRTVNDVRSALMEPAAAETANGRIDVRDLVFGGGNEVWVRTDGVREATGVQVAECVGYIRRGTEIIREVRPDSADCRTGAQPLVRKVVMRGIPADAGPIFSYARMYNPELARMTQIGELVDPARCVSVPPVTDLPATSPELAGVTAVVIDLRAVIARGDSMGESALRDSVTIRSRVNHEYLFGLGCSF